MEDKLPVFADETFTPHWLLQQSNEEYHADKTAVSSSALRQILRSPWAFYAAHTGIYKNDDDGENEAYRIGTAIHMAILEPELFKLSYQVAPKFSGTGAVKKREEWKASLSPGAIVLSEKEFRELQHMVDAVKRHEDARNALWAGQAEVSGYFKDPITGIKCRIRPDFLHKSGRCMADVKSTRQIDKRNFGNSIQSYSYDFQMAFYIMGVREITGKDIEMPIFIVVEKFPPFEVAVYQATERMLIDGEKKVRKALDQLRICLELNSWDFAQTSMEEIDKPEWAYKEE